jgi:hypothetical protein
MPIILTKPIGFKEKNRSCEKTKELCKNEFSLKNNKNHMVGSL